MRGLLCGSGVRSGYVGVGDWWKGTKYCPKPDKLRGGHAWWPYRLKSVWGGWAGIVPDRGPSLPVLSLPITFLLESMTRSYIFEMSKRFSIFSGSLESQAWLCECHRSHHYYQVHDWLWTTLHPPRYKKSVFIIWLCIQSQRFPRFSFSRPPKWSPVDFMTTMYGLLFGLECIK